MSLETLLPTLANPEHMPHATELLALSNLAGDDLVRVLDVWRTLSIQRRRDIVDALADLIEDNVELDFTSIFIAGLTDSDVQVRADSIKSLWEYEEDDLVPPLLTLLADPEALVRAEAALGLGRALMRMELLDRDDAVAIEIEDALRAVVHSDSELVEVRGRALEAVGVRGKEWVSDLIDEAYASGERRLTLSAVHAMGRNADLNWMPTIIEEMSSEDGEMQFEAATAAGAIGDEEAIPYLAELTGDEDVEVQEAAIAALGLIGGPSARSVLHAVAAEHRDERVLDAVSEALAEADFAEDPLGFQVHLDESVAADADEDDDQ